MNIIKKAYNWCLKPEHLFFITLITLILPNAALCITDGLSVTASLANVLLPLGCYWLLMTLTRKPGKMIWWLFFFIFLAAFQLVLLYLFGRNIIAVDMFLNLVTTNPGEAMELLDNLLPAVIGVFVIYLPVLGLGVMSAIGRETLPKPFIHNQRLTGTSIMALGIISLATSYISDKYYRAETDLYPANVLYNMVLAGERTYLTEHYAETSKDFKFHASPTVADSVRQVYVMIIGETARACEFQLYGYRRPTTPLLAKEADLVAFTNVMSQSNTTHKSVPMLMSAASAVDYNRIYREKGIIQAFKEAGFHTTFISNQLPNHSFIDFFGKEADDWKFIKQDSGEGRNTPDTEMQKMLSAILARKRQKEFIVLHSYGSHFNYRDRYPRSVAFFRPDDATEAKAANRSQLINAYDNTIRYTDTFLGSIINTLRRSGCMAAMLYTSDHGENIFDDSRKLFLHASPCPSYYELHVPFLVWTSERYNAIFPDKLPTMRLNRNKPVASSASFFHSMLGIAGIRTPYLADSLNVASQKLHSAPRRYLNDHNEPMTLEKIGLKREDFALMKQHKVEY